jgi:hypothetical protein
LITGSNAAAQTFRDWLDTGSDWSTAANWNGSDVPDSTTEVARFNSDASIANQPTLSANITVGGIDIDNSGQAWNLSSNTAGTARTLTLGSFGVTLQNVTSARTSTFSSDVNIGISTDQTWTIGTNNTLVIDGDVTMSNNKVWTRAGSGTLILNDLVAFANPNSTFVASAGLTVFSTTTTFSFKGAGKGKAGGDLQITNGTVILNTTSTTNGTISSKGDLNIVATGGTLGGTGIFPSIDLTQGATTNATTTIAPGSVDGSGNSLVGSMRVGTSADSRNMTFSNASTYSVQIGGKTTAGTDYDELVVFGNTTVGGNLDVTLINGFTASIGDTFTIIREGQSSTGTLSGTFATVNGTAVGAGNTFTLDGLTWQIQYNTLLDPYTVVLAVIPEPASIALLGSVAIAGLGLGWWRNRRRTPCSPV